MGSGERAARRGDDEIVYDVIEWATARGAWAADGMHLSREHVLALAEEIRLEVITYLHVTAGEQTRRMHAEGFFRQERDQLILDNQLDPRRQRAWDVVDAFVAAQGSRVRLTRTVLERSTFELARIDPVAEGAASVEVLISDDAVLVSIGAGGRYELDIDDEDLQVLAALLEAVGAGRYVEDLRVGASRYEATLADGTTIKGSEQDILWSLRWGRRHLTYRAYSRRPDIPADDRLPVREPRRRGRRRRAMTSRRAAVVPVLLLLLAPTACGSTASGSGACAEGTVGECQDNGVVVADDDTPASDGEEVRLVATSPIDEAMEATTGGVVDVVDGCLGISHDGGTSTVVSWPRGSKLLDDPVGVRLPSGRELHVGDPLQASGGQVTAGPEETQACPTAEEVWMLGGMTDDR